jgi:MOSC domain-containing protein YiiM
MSGRVLSVNVSPVRSVEIRGKTVMTGIYKTPVGGRVPLRGVNARGDDQADRNAHGGPDRAVYAYANEDYRWWETSLERTLVAGTFGENLTLAGVDVSGARIGERWRAGGTLLQVTAPRVPCFKLAHVMGDPGFVRRFAQALRPGAYLSIVEEGEIGAGDAVEVIAKPRHALTVAAMTHIYFNDRSRLAELLVPELPDEWRGWVEEQRARRDAPQR